MILFFKEVLGLSKAHAIIPRMSEDIDFKIQAKNKTLGRYSTRKYLRAFRKEIVENLTRENYFLIEKPKVFYEGGYMTLRIEYPSIFSEPTAKHMKSFIAVDFFVGDVVLEIERKQIATLIRKALGEKIEHAVKHMECLSVTETAAEKWVGLTRRIATIKHKNHY